MKFALIAVVIVTFVGCAREVAQPLPTAPSPSVATAPNPPIIVAPDPPALPPPMPRELTFIWVVVLEGASDECFEPAATVEIVAGQGLGRRVTQSTLRCSYWDPQGVIFPELNVGEELTIRASAQGYTANEKTVIPTPGGQFATTILLSRIQ